MRGRAVARMHFRTSFQCLRASSHPHLVLVMVVRSLQTIVALPHTRLSLSGSIYAAYRYSDNHLLRQKEKVHVAAAYRDCR